MSLFSSRTSLLIVAVMLLSGCTRLPVSGKGTAPSDAYPQSHVFRSGPLEIRLDRAGSRGGAFRVPPPGTEWLSCDVEVVNTSDSTITVRAKEGQLLLYDGEKPVKAEGTGATFSKGYRVLFGGSGVLPAKAEISMYNNFAVRPEQRNLTLVCRLPGYPQFKWRVR